MRSNEVQDRVTLAAANFTPVHGQAKATVEKMASVVEEAAAQGVDLVVFPENALLGCESCEACRVLGGPCDDCIESAQTVPGPATEAIARLARDHDLYVVFGLPERDARDRKRLYNAAAVVGPDGVLGSYRKVHLGEPPWVTEGITFTPGTALPLFPTRFGLLGVQICYDFWFNPELTRILALKGARLVAVPVGSFEAPGRPEGMRATVLARAQENLIHVVVSNAVGGPDGPGQAYSGRALTEASRPNYYAGHSMIAGPAFPRFGVSLAEAGATEELVVATINLKQQARFDTIFDYRRWRRGRLASASKLVAEEFAALAASESESR
jgi:predicted amidohydrolase